MTYNGITFEKLSFFEQYFDDPLIGIPEESGIYYWVYFPEYDPNIFSANDLKNKINDYVTKSLLFAEEVKGRYKFEATIKEQGYPSNGEMFGLSNSKAAKLYNYFQTSSNRSFFLNFFKELCFSRPFYVGKANNLRNRLVKQHFKGLTEIMPELKRHSITATDVWVGYKLIPDANNDEINNIFEEIFSRKIKPGLTKKPN